MANNCKQCFNTHYQPHCHPTTKSLWLCSSVYFADRRTNLVVYGWRLKPPTKKALYIMGVVRLCHSMVTTLSAMTNFSRMSHRSPVDSPRLWPVIQYGDRDCFLSRPCKPKKCKITKIYEYFVGLNGKKVEREKKFKESLIDCISEKWWENQMCDKCYTMTN